MIPYHKRIVKRYFDKFTNLRGSELPHIYRKINEVSKDKNQDLWAKTGERVRESLKNQN